MDATAVTEISDPAIGILMKSMAIMKKAKGYLVLVMTEDFLQKIMVAHPEMFNYMAVFHSVMDAPGLHQAIKKITFRAAGRTCGGAPFTSFLSLSCP